MLAAPATDLVCRAAGQESGNVPSQRTGDPTGSGSRASVAGPSSSPAQNVPATRQDPGAPADGANASDAPTRMREGTELVEVLGYFRVLGDRVTFHSGEPARQFGGLPNLNLERIVRTVRDQTEPMMWSVSGTVTEFQGANYLLIQRARLKGQQQGSGAPQAGRSAEVLRVDPSSNPRAASTGKPRPPAKPRG